MLKWFVVGMCCMSITYASLKEDIMQNFDKCLLESDEKIAYTDYNGENYSSSPKSECFEKFLTKYGNILKKHCFNNNKDECIKLIEAHTHYDVSEIPEIANKFLEICEGRECYIAGEIIGFETDIAQPLLEKACKANIEDACYAVGK